MAVTVIERCYARAAVYRLLSLLFRYPTEESWPAVQPALDAALVAGEVLPPSVAAAIAGASLAVRDRGRDALADEHRSLFTFSASPDCPLNESAYSAKHLFQEVQELADIAGFYRAFGLEMNGERPDDLSAELEFCYLLALKEGLARERRLRTEQSVCRDAHRAFVREHLGRWADNIGRRLLALAPETAYAAFGRLLSEFVTAEIDFLRVGPVRPHEEVPNPPPPPDDNECPAVPGLADGIDEEDLVAELAPVSEPTTRRGG